MKHCNGCDKDLSVNNFDNDSSKKCGKQSQCKKCKTEGKNSLSSRYTKYKGDAARRGYSFTLTKKQFDGISSQPCFYCGFFNGEDIDGRPYNGIDRKNNSKGYIKNNSIPCCSLCNYFKAALHEIDFLEHVKAIYEFQIKKAKQ